jgi:hypothetical protein
MPTVTVQGASGHAITLNYDSQQATNLAQRLADSITAQLRSGRLVEEDNMAPTISGATPGTSLGAVDSVFGAGFGQVLGDIFGNSQSSARPASGEFVQTQDGSFTLPGGYSAVVEAAANATVSGSLDDRSTVLAGSGNFTFDPSAGSGTVLAGGGADSINLASDTIGLWRVALGNGDDTVTLGSSPSFVSLGTGNDQVNLGSGEAVIENQGNTTITGAQGTITVGQGNHLVLSLDGSEAVLSGSIAQQLETLLNAGTGNATLGGGKSSDDLSSYFHGNSTGRFAPFGSPETMPGGVSGKFDHEGSGKTLTLKHDTKISFASPTDMSAHLDKHTLIPQR